MDPSPSPDGVDRRTYLSTLATGVLASSGIVGAASAQSIEDEYRTVVDVVDEGAADDGSASVSPVVDDLVDNDTLIKFPPGRYYMDEQVRLVDFWNLGLVGPEATLVPANYYNFDGPKFRLFRLGTHDDPSTELLVDGFTVDQTAPDTGIRAFDVVVDDGLHVRDITVDGRHDSGTFGPARFDVLDPDGAGVVERFEAPDGGQWISETPAAEHEEDPLWRGPTGILANMTEGTLRFTDCVVGGFPDNGLYSSGGSGRRIVEGGRYENSHGNSVRIGGTDSVIRNVTVRVDEAPTNFETQRGIRLQKGDNIRIEDTSVTVTGPNGGSTGVVTEDSCGELWIENLDVTIDTAVANTGIKIAEGTGYTTIYETGLELHGPGGYGVLIEGPDGSAGAKLEHLDIVGDVGDEGARAGIRNTRNDVEFRAVNVDQSGGDDRYALVNKGDDCLVYEGDFIATRYPILESGTGTKITEVYAKSYDGDRGAIALHDDSEDVYLKNNTLRGGIDDYGCDGLKTVGNEF